ncbi:glycosyltransferase family 2 protein [Microbacterium sp.]|jgi:glycosyltransferase involved in cell wall biosynthesis|uniref:glycosyltransferase family 2 protein n=1 Tax=Microbacterium sp. TaxID=51671 RepID=UPI002C233BEE|nr:glycosyltransferase family 2 protein [Microbacterium sp.]HWL78711.1 glycosyltransferase family 2 protein [Microbacterium sp.]
MTALRYYGVCGTRPGTIASGGSTLHVSHLAVVMPAYNEAEGIASFVGEIADSVSGMCDRLSVVVVDDCSTDDMPRVLDDLADADPRVMVEHRSPNRGHGPTALAAYRRGLELEPDVIVHVDGDGQFHGADIARVARALSSHDADVVHGIRRDRTDPWFRRALTASVSVVVGFAVGRRVPDSNTPLRAYRPAVLEELVSSLPNDALVPHVHFSLAEVRRAYDVRYVAVRSLPRRGSDATGTMWGGAKSPKLPPKRLRQFARRAAAELWRYSLRPGRGR